MVVLDDSRVKRTRADPAKDFKGKTLQEAIYLEVRRD